VGPRGQRWDIDSVHYCEDIDDLTRWSWLQHEGSTCGRQFLVDRGLVLTTYFVKSAEQGSGRGGYWVVRIKGE
jgi:mannosyl-oligosaccharide glucosidase